MKRDTMVYLDNAATTFPKPESVYNEMNCCLKEYCANPSRGGHKMAIDAGKAVMEAREVISNFFNISNSLRLCFTKNATEAINIAIKGIIKPKDHVITTSMEHNSVLRPLKIYERDMGIEISFIPSDNLGEINPDQIQKMIKKNTRLIISTLSSNVNGIIMPVKEIGEIARKNGLVFLLDASQGAGSLKVDVENMNVDLLAFPGHKALMGPQGTGGLYIKEGLKLDSIIFGGTGSNSENYYQPEEMPDVMESGTLNTPGIVGLRYGIEYINQKGIENIRKHKWDLVKRMIDGVSQIRGISLYSKNDYHKNSGIVGLNFNKVPSTELSYILDKLYKIETRAGLHCSPMAHHTLGTETTGLVRFSFSCMNNIEETDYAIKALEEISTKLPE